jgi:hypothetical protein
MPSERSEVAVAAVGGRREFEIYDSAADRRSRGASIPHPAHHTAAVGLNGKLCVIGGYAGGWTPAGSAHEHNPASDRWRALAPIPTPRGAPAAAVLDGRIFVVEGEAPPETFNEVEACDPEGNGWTSYARCRRHVTARAAAAVDGRMRTSAGGPTPGRSASAST